MAFTAGQKLTAAMLEELPQGYLTQDASGQPAGTGTIQAGAGTAEVVRRTTPAVATVAGRKYRVVGYVTYAKGSSNRITPRIRRGTTTAGTLISLDDVLGDSGGRVRARLEVIDQPGTQAAQQWCFTTNGDTGTHDITHPSAMWVEDIGPV